MVNTIFVVFTDFGGTGAILRLSGALPRVIDMIIYEIWIQGAGWDDKENFYQFLEK